MIGRRIAAVLGVVTLTAGLAACGEEEVRQRDPLPAPQPTTSQPTAAPTAAPQPTTAPQPTAAPAPSPSPTQDRNAIHTANGYDLAALAESCAAGVWTDCDDLFTNAPLASDYYYWGATCGGVEPNAVRGLCHYMVTRGEIPTIETNPTELAAMVSACEGGDLGACDLSFHASLVDSPEENVAITCGGTREIPIYVEWCTDYVPMDYGDDPYQDGLYDRCAAGDMPACEVLALYAELDSEYYDLGIDCGGHIPEGTIVNNCEDLQ